MADRVRSYPQKKLKYFTHMNELFDSNDKVVVVDADNVGSNQMQNIRMAMRGKADLLLGKNTMMKRCLQNRLNASNSDRDKLLYSKFVNDRLIAGNIGLIFTNDDLSTIKEIVQKHRVQAPAKAGALAPVDVQVPAGNTGLEPTKTSFFQALNIPTNITKGTVEILKDQQVVTAGEKVGSSEAALLQMLNIKPFYYGLEIRKIYDAGSVYGAQVLDWGESDIVAKFQAGAGRVRCFAMGLGIPTKATIEAIMLNGFKKIMAISLATEYEFEEFNGKDLRAAILAGPVVSSGGGGGGGGGGGDAPKVEAKKEEEEDSDEEMGFGLFD